MVRRVEVRRAICNITIWRAIRLLHRRGLSENKWEEVLSEAIDAVHSLVSLPANETPHERLFRFPRKAMTSLAVWHRLHVY